jgi:hypothetical protein
MRVTIILGLIAMLAMDSIFRENAFFWTVWAVVMLLNFISICKGE